MYSRWARRHSRSVEILDVTHGGKTGIRSATIQVDGPHAFGLLKGEAGVHRLSRVSTFDSSGRRHTSFARVEVIPEIPAEPHLDIRPTEVKLQTFRSSGPGGQSVQKLATAVRVIHLPTGITATCQTERSQLQNRANAMRLLRARVLECQNQVKRPSPGTPAKITAGWGRQIRSYVLNPQTLVKDHRTNCQTTAAIAVLDGQIDDFIKAYLLGEIGQYPEQ